MEFVGRPLVAVVAGGATANTSSTATAFIGIGIKWRYPIISFFPSFFTGVGNNGGRHVVDTILLLLGVYSPIIIGAGVDRIVYPRFRLVCVRRRRVLITHSEAIRADIFAPCVLHEALAYGIP